MATETYHCVVCKKNRPGRFTRVKEPGTIGKGWPSRGKGLPAWYCYTCLPAGSGSDETKDTPMPVKTPAPVVLAKMGDLSKTKQEGLAVVSPLQVQVDTLEVLTAEDYALADTLLARVRTARKTWNERMERIIRPIRTGLDELYSLNREVDKPLMRLEESVKGQMKEFKLIEQREIAAAEQKKFEAVEKLRREAEEKQRQAEAARTPQVRGRLMVSSERLQQAAVVVEQQETQAPVQAVSSSSRKLKVVKVKDILAFCGAIADGAIPHDMIIVHPGPLAKAYKENPEEVAQWPGIEIVDDVQIVGR